jgi:ribonuclease D
LQPVHITDNAALAEVAQRIATLDSIALDTEFMRVDTFHPILGLIQIGDGQHEYLIDPLKVTDLSPLAPVVGRVSAQGAACLLGGHRGADPSCRCPAERHFGHADCHAFLGQGLQVGYQKALQDNLGVDIPKDESRSDWLARPLSEGQIAYAALDVKYLPPLVPSCAGWSAVARSDGVF